MPFGEPDEVGGVRLNPRDIINHLVMVWATDYVAHSPTRHTKAGKPSDVIVVDVVDLDQMGEDGQQGLLARKVWWRQTKLIMSLKGRIGYADPVLARMGLGVPTQGLPPFELFSMTQDPECVQRANVWLTGHPNFTPSSPGPAAEPVKDDSHWGNSNDQPDWSKAPVSGGAPAQPAEVQRQETLLERMARQSQEGVSRLPAPPRQGDQPPY